MEDLSGVVDLAELGRAREVFEEQRANAEAASKDRAMTRAFKGIVPAPERRKALGRRDA